MSKTKEGPEANNEFIDSEDEDHLALPSFTEEELDQKISDFKGLGNELDEETNKTVGKLLVEEADENVNPDKETVVKMFKILGGFSGIGFWFVLVYAQKNFHFYHEMMMNEYASVDPE